jgi:hypothetical protein
MTTQPQSPSEQEIRNITSEYSFEPGHEDECALFDDEDCNCKYRRDWELWNEMHQRIADLIAQAADKREQEVLEALLQAMDDNNDPWRNHRDLVSDRLAQLRQGRAAEGEGNK